MLFDKQILVAAALAACSAAATAGTTTYTQKAEFLPAVAAGSYTEGFFDPFFDNTPSATFSGGAFTYTISAPGALYGKAGFIGTNTPNEALTLDISGTPVTAIGGNFWATDINDVYQRVPVTITLSDGTVTTFEPLNVPNSYRGFVSTIPITSLVVSPAGTTLYVGLDNLTVGNAIPVPEPGTWLLMGLGIGALVLRQTRRAVKA